MPAVEIFNSDNFKSLCSKLARQDHDLAIAESAGACRLLNQFDDFFQQWERGKVDDLDAGLAKTDEEIDKALQLGQAP